MQLGTQMSGTSPVVTVGLSSGRLNCGDRFAKWLLSWRWADARSHDLSPICPSVAGNARYGTASSVLASKPRGAAGKPDAVGRPGEGCATVYETFNRRQVRFLFDRSAGRAQQSAVNGVQSGVKGKF